MQVWFMRTKRQPHPNLRPKASAADVLGKIGPAPVVPVKWRKYHERLIEMRSYLVDHQRGSANDASAAQPTYSMHIADAGTDEFDRDFALSMVSSDQEALYEIDQALNRIHTGTYGICELTGRRIEVARLEAIPWTRFSAAAEEKLEREGGVAKTRLGPRAQVPRGTEIQPSSEDEPQDEE